MLPDLIHPVQIPRSVEVAGKAKLALVLDIDEMILFTVSEHVRKMRAALLMSGVDRKNIPTLEEALAGGGTKVFERVFDKNEAGEPVEKYRERYAQVNAFMRDSQRFNHHIPLIDEQTPAILAQATEAGFPTIMYLTTRPQGVEKVTADDLARLGMPDAPVLCRPDHIDLSQTTAWKLKTLITLADNIPGTVVMVDDSLSLIRAIAEKNHPKVRGLLFQGPVTPNDHAETSTTWPTFIQSLQQIAASIS